MPMCEMRLPWPNVSRSPGLSDAMSRSIFLPTRACSRDVRGSLAPKCSITYCTSPLQSKPDDGDSAPRLYLTPSWACDSATMESRSAWIELLSRWKGRGSGTGLGRVTVTPCAPTDDTNRAPARTATPIIFVIRFLPRVFSMLDQGKDRHRMLQSRKETDNYMCRITLVISGGRDRHVTFHIPIFDRSVAVGADRQIAANPARFHLAGCLGPDGHVTTHGGDLNLAGSVARDGHRAGDVAEVDRAIPINDMDVSVDVGDDHVASAINDVELASNRIDIEATVAMPYS